MDTVKQIENESAPEQAGEYSANSPITVAIDVMGGDHGPKVVLAACFKALKANKNLSLILVGDESIINERLKKIRAANKYKPDVTGEKRYVIQHASEIVGMGEAVASALRTKKDSSMRVAINMVKHGRAQACVSAGNTGALMATARFVLKTLPGIDRPAIISALPSTNGHTHMLDLGANLELEPEHLYQFAIMGSAVTSLIDGTDRPKVGLLNVGVEDIKGGDKIKRAAELIQASSLNYIGFVEGNDIYLGDVDVVVCDGFTGNVALKTSEGLAKMIGSILRAEFTRSPIYKLAALMGKPAFNAVKNRLDPRRYNGASMVGLRGVVIKSHGSADVKAYANAIKIAAIQAKQNAPSLIAESLTKQVA